MTNKEAIEVIDRIVYGEDINVITRTIRGTE